MAKKKTLSAPHVNKTKLEKPSLTQGVFQQAKDSLRLLQTLERETMAKAKTLVKNPIDHKRIGRERILMTLRRIGVGTQSELDALKARVEKLETEAALRRGTREERSEFSAAKSARSIPHS